jgi:hypothetical protein
VCAAPGGMKGCGASTKGLFHIYCTSPPIYVLCSLFMRNLLNLAKRNLSQQMPQLEEYYFWGIRPKWSLFLALGTQKYESLYSPLETLPLFLCVVCHWYCILFALYLLKQTITLIGRMCCDCLYCIMDFLHVYVAMVGHITTATHRFLAWLLWYLLIGIFVYKVDLTPRHTDWLTDCQP